MDKRRLFLAKHRSSANQRCHFALFIPNSASDSDTLVTDFQTQPCIGTVLHVVGEPLMAGYVFQIKRNFDCHTSPDLKELVLLDYIDEDILYETASSDEMVEEHTPRGTLEEYMANVEPPPRRQDVRAPIDGINTRRCQEWTMEVLNCLVNQDVIGSGAIEIAQRERDSPTHGIFGQNKQA